VDSFGGYCLPKASQKPGQSEDIPRESSGRDPSGDGAFRDSKVAGASQACVEAEGGNFEWHYYK